MNILSILMLFGQPVLAPASPYQTKWARPPVEVVQEEIRTQAKKYGVNVTTSIRIAACESGFDAFAENENSSAKGIFQWLDGSYKQVGGKDPFDYKENIKLFLENYPRHKAWWQCK